MEICDLRHLDGVRTNFGIVDGKATLLHRRGQAREDYTQKIIQLLEKAISQYGIRFRILVSKDIQKQIEKLITRQQKAERRKEYD